MNTALKKPTKLRLIERNGRTYAPISQLRNWEKNPRGITRANFERLKRQIIKLGEYKPLIVTEEGTVLGGNMRLRVYREMGYREVWVSIVRPESEAQKIEYAISDNDQAGHYEEEKLSELILPHLQELDLSDYSISLGHSITLQELATQFGPIQEDDFDIDAELDKIDEPDSKRGHVYELGRHRLICGDATNETEVAQLMGETKADMIFTDPPYNVNYVGKTKDALTIENDDFKDHEKYVGFLTKSITNMAKFTKLGGAAYICHADSEGLAFRQAFVTAGFELKQCIIWNKNSMVMGRQDYHWKHEPILYGWQKGASHKWHGGRRQTTVWDVERPVRSRSHPTMKPIALIARAIRNSSKQGDNILDLFAGSGSSLIAAEQTGRTAYVMELDPKYCDVIRKRYEHYVQEK